MTLRNIFIKFPEFESAFHVFENMRLLRIETKICDCCSVDLFMLGVGLVVMFLLLGIRVGQLANMAAYLVPLHSKTIVVFQPLLFSYLSFSKGQFTHAIFVAPI